MHLVIFVGSHVVFAANSIPTNVNIIKTDNNSGSIINLHGAKSSEIKSIGGMNNKSGSLMKNGSAALMSNTNKSEIRKPFEQQKIYGRNGKELFLMEKGMFKTRPSNMIDLGSKNESSTTTPTIIKEEGLKTKDLRKIELDMIILQAEWNKSQECYAILSDDWKKLNDLHLILMRNEWHNVIDYDAKPKTKTSFFGKYFIKARNKIVEETEQHKNMHKENLSNKIIEVNKKWKGTKIYFLK